MASFITFTCYVVEEDHLRVLEREQDIMKPLDLPRITFRDTFLAILLYCLQWEEGPNRSDEFSEFLRRGEVGGHF